MTASGMTVMKRQVQTVKGKMRFKGFSFDVNPNFIEIRHRRIINEKALLNGKSRVTGGALCPAEITGRGSFYGVSAPEKLQMLESLHKKGGEGWLYLPQGGAYKVYFKELTFSFNADKNRYEYSFVFVECTNSKKPSFDFSYTVADDGENLFQIARRCRVPVERLMELNDFATPFSVDPGDKVVLK